MQEWENIVNDYSGLFSEELNKVALWNEVRGDIRERVASAHESVMSMPLIRASLVDGKDYVSHMADDEEAVQGYSLSKHGLDTWNVLSDGQVLDDAIIFYSNDYFIARIDEEQSEFRTLEDAWAWLQEQLEARDEEMLAENEQVYPNSTEQQMQEVACAINEHDAYRRRPGGEQENPRTNWESMYTTPQPIGGNSGFTADILMQVAKYNRVLYRGELTTPNGDVYTTPIYPTEGDPTKAINSVMSDLKRRFMQMMPNATFDMKMGSLNKEAWDAWNMLGNAGINPDSDLDSISIPKLIGLAVKMLLVAGVVATPDFVSAALTDFKRGYGNSNYGATVDGFFDFLYARAQNNGGSRNSRGKMLRSIRASYEKDAGTEQNGVYTQDNGILSGIAFCDPKVGYCYGIFSRDGYEGGAHADSYESAKEHVASILNAVAEIED